MLNEDYLYQLIGERLASARKRKLSLSQDAIAERLHISRTSVSNIERGKQKAPLSLLYLYCIEIDKDINEIIPSLNEVVTKKTGTTIILNGKSQVVPDKVAKLINAIDEDFLEI